MVVLIHVANVLYLFSYLVKDILWLRLLTVVAGSVLLAYYVLLPAPLWAAIGWNVVFLAINIRQIHVLLLERRPVRLTPDELRLHQLAFRSLSQREFAKLLRLARWESIAADHRFVSKGQPLDRIMVIADGRACVEIAGAPGVELRPGCFVGEMSFLTGQTPNADVVATEATRLVTWPQTELKAFLGRDAELRAIVQMAIGEDLVAKLGYSRAS
ncbi:MAG TPA: cyclic nucleotide-binding domain-containing protein [Polyangiaceae bacterium]|nr:cyclic nucleotide-binding domain-containing protein [Polyangiaceae bacterium]